MVVLAVELAIYAGWYRPYAKDHDALRTYVLADKLFLRSSKTANSEANLIGKLPYGSELITYEMDGEWAKVKTANGEIQAVSYRNGRYGVRFSTTPAPDRHTAQEEQHTISAPPVTPSKENIVEQVVEAVENDAITTEDIAESTPEEEPERPAPAEDNDTYEVVEEMPKYPGGTEAMMAFIGQHLQYPSVSIENGVQGRVVVQFVIEKDGTPTDFKVIRSVDPYLDKEAIRVLSLMPKWTPGRQRGVPVKVRYTVPVTFRLQ